MFVLGLLYRSRLDIRAARIGMTLGIICAVTFEIVPSLYAIFGGGVIPAIAATVLGTWIPDLFLHRHVR